MSSHKIKQNNFLLHQYRKFVLAQTMHSNTHCHKRRALLSWITFKFSWRALDPLAVCLFVCQSISLCGNIMRSYPSLRLKEVWLSLFRNRMWGLTSLLQHAFCLSFLRVKTVGACVWPACMDIITNEWSWDFIPHLGLCFHGVERGYFSFTFVSCSTRKSVSLMK
jgi:hypothetical protein